VDGTGTQFFSAPFIQNIVLAPAPQPWWKVQPLTKLSSKDMSGFYWKY